MELNVIILLFFLISNITLLIMLFNRLFAIILYMLLLLIILKKRNHTEHFEDINDAKINKILYNQKTQKLIDNVIKKDECIDYEKFKILVNNVLDKLSFIPMASTIVKLYISDDEIKKVFNKFLKNKSNRGNNNPNKLCRSELEDILKIYINYIINKIE